MGVLVLHGEAFGFLDLEGIRRFGQRKPYRRAVVLVRKGPVGRVLEEASKVGIEIRAVRDPKGEARRVAEGLRQRGEDVRVLALEEVADRSMMRDVF